MKIKISSLILLFILLASLSGCKTTEKTSGDDRKESGLEISDAQYSTDSDSSIRDNEASGADNSTKQNDSQAAIRDKAESKEETVTINTETSYDEKELIESAQTMYELACKTYWEYDIGIIYNLDRSSFVENEWGWKFYEVTDEHINSFSDVEKDYGKVFCSGYGHDLSELFIEKNGKVYELAGDRGRDMYFVSSKVTALRATRDVGNGYKLLTFDVESLYSGSDSDPDTEIITPSIMDILVSDKGECRVGEFTMPY